MKITRLLLVKIFENKYDRYLKKGNFLKATLWGRLYYHSLSSHDKRSEGIRNVNATVNQDIRSNFFGHQPKIKEYSTPITGVAVS